jgi:hypothetical protein
MCCRCKAGVSASVDEPGIPPLCDRCWGEVGEGIIPGVEVMDTESPSLKGTVKRLEDNLAVVIIRGERVWLPVATLITTSAGRR